MAPSRTSSTMGGALSIVLAAATWVNAQSASTPSPTPTDVPTCNPGFQWAFNSLGQSPCQIASALAAACLKSGTNFPIPALQPNESYNGPGAKELTGCRCSSVYYSVLSACALCQGASVSLWTQYNKNCRLAFVTVFPTAIPAGVTVPNYAYLDVLASSGEFNATLAQNAGGAESSAVPQPTAGSKPTASTSHAGAIAGGVVGGIVGLLLMIFLVYSLLRMRNRRQAPGPILDMLGDGKTNPYGETPKLYDPNDPASFSQAMAQLTGSTHSLPSQGRQFTGTPSALSRANAQYSGVTEVM